MKKLFFTYGAARFAPAIFNVLALIIYVRLLEPAQFGIFALIQAASIVANEALSLWLNIGIVRFFPIGKLPAQRVNFNFTLQAALVLTMLVSTVFAFIIYAGLKIWGNFDAPGLLVIAGLVLTWAESLHLMCLNICQAQEHARRFTALTILRAVFMLLFGVLFITLLDLKATGPIFGMCAGIVVSVLIAAPKDFFKISGGRFLRQSFKDLWNYGSPISASLLLQSGITYADRFIIGVILGTEAVAVYALAADFANRAIGIPLQVVNTTFFPRIVQVWESKNQEKIASLISNNGALLLLIGVPSAVGIACIAPNAIPLLFGEQYMEKAPLLAAIFAIVVPLTALRKNHVDIRFNLAKNTIPQIIIAAIIAPVSILLNWITLPVFGLYGAGVIAVVVQVLYLFVGLQVSKRHREIPLHIADWPILLIPSVVMFAVIFFIPNEVSLPMLLIQITLGGMVYGAAAFSFNIVGFRDLIIDRMTSKKPIK